MTTPRMMQIGRDDPAAIQAEAAAELIAGLSATPARVSPKYFYDALGARLFAAITALPEYYPTRTEASIFARELASMAEALGPAHTLVDLGAGNCEKAARLFAAFQVRRYVAVDIAAAYLRESLTDLQRQHPAIEMLGIGLDFSTSLVLPAAAGRVRACCSIPDRASAISRPTKPPPSCGRRMPPARADRC